MKGKLLISIFFTLALFSFKEGNISNVLIIGDSISLGYTRYVRSALEGRANVVHNKGNARHTGYGLENIDEWLGDTSWDVIHFNWGLWDLCYRNPDSKTQGNRDKIDGAVTYTPEQYGENLEALVIRLRKTGAKLIFAETSYVPKGEAGRFFKSDKIYNGVAKRIMKKYGVSINSLNAVSKKVHKEHAAGEGNVHFTKKGYELLSKEVIKSIANELEGI